jgi:Flp pilus assembly protein TadD
MSISGVVADAESHVRMDGVRVDLHGASGGILATAFTTTNGNFQFNNIRSGSYELVFEQSGYQDDREHMDIDAPVFGMTVQLKRVGGGAGSPTGPTVSVRELSIPRKAREAMDKGMALFYQKSDYPGSIKQFQRAIQAYPDYYEAYALMGMVYIKMNDAGQAEQVLRKSIDISHERYADGFALLSALYSSQKRFADAEPLARKAVEIDAKSWHGQSELAQALLGLNRADEAESYARSAASLAPQNPTMCLLLADVHIALRNDTALLEDLNSYLKLAPNGPYAEKVREQREAVQQRLQNSQAAPPASPSASHANP